MAYSLQLVWLVAYISFTRHFCLPTRIVKFEFRYHFLYWCNPWSGWKSMSQITVFISFWFLCKIHSDIKTFDDETFDDGIFSASKLKFFLIWGPSILDNCTKYDFWAFPDRMSCYLWPIPHFWWSLISQPHCWSAQFLVI